MEDKFVVVVKGIIIYDKKVLIIQQNNIDIIYAVTEDYNKRAQKCILKSGFKLDAVLEHAGTSKGKAEYCYLMNKETYMSKHTV